MTQCKEYISGLAHLVRHQHFKAILLYFRDFDVYKLLF